MLGEACARSVFVPRSVVRANGARVPQLDVRGVAGGVVVLLEGGLVKERGEGGWGKGATRWMCFFRPEWFDRTNTLKS